MFALTPRPQESPRQRQAADRATQLGRVLRELGSGWIGAFSRQAQGRVERSLGTDPDRLGKLLRLAKGQSMTGAHEFLEPEYWPGRERAVRAALAGDGGSAPAAHGRARSGIESESRPVAGNRQPRHELLRGPAVSERARGRAGREEAPAPAGGTTAGRNVERPLSGPLAGAGRVRAEGARRACGAAQAASQGPPCRWPEPLDGGLLGAPGAVHRAGHGGVESACVRRGAESDWGRRAKTARRASRPMAQGLSSSQTSPKQRGTAKSKPKAQNPLIAACSPPPEGSQPMRSSEPAASSPRPWAPRPARPRRGWPSIPQALAAAAQNRNFLLGSQPQVFYFALTPSIRLVATDHGGHIGFLARGAPRFWADAVAMEWTQRAAFPLRRP